VDACNGVMEKMNYPKGLISFTSETELAGGKTKILRPKLIGYGIVLLLMSGLLVFEIASRKPLEIDIIKDRVPMFRESGNGLIENVFTLKILNKSQTTQRYHIYIDNLEGHTYIGEDEVTVAGGEVFNLPLSIAISPKKLTQESTEFSFRVESVDGEDSSVKVQEISKFLYPDL
jgi:polyferredoxin